MLAVWLGLRQSEILGLEWRDIDGDTLKIRRAIVLGEDGPTQKGTKTYSGTRPLHIPAYIRELLDRQPRSGDRIVNMTGKSIYSGFSHSCEKAVPHTSVSTTSATSMPPLCWPLVFRTNTP